jgi:hypothetical protein
MSTAAAPPVVHVTVTITITNSKCDIATRNMPMVIVVLDHDLVPAAMQPAMWPQGCQRASFDAGLTLLAGR